MIPVAVGRSYSVGSRIWSHFQSPVWQILIQLWEFSWDLAQIEVFKNSQFPGKMFSHLALSPYGTLTRSQVALVVKDLPANAGDVRDGGSVPVSGISPGEGKDNPL